MLTLFSLSGCSCLNKISEQKIEKRIERADLAFVNKDYKDAITNYKKAYEAINNSKRRAELIFKLGKCYYELKIYDEAIFWFNKIQGKFPDPLAVKYLAKSYFCNNEFNNALRVYESYKSLVPDDHSVDFEINECKKKIE